MPRQAITLGVLAGLLISSLGLKIGREVVRAADPDPLNTRMEESLAKMGWEPIASTPLGVRESMIPVTVRRPGCSRTASALPLPPGVAGKAVLERSLGDPTLYVFESKAHLTYPVGPVLKSLFRHMAAFDRLDDPVLAVTTPADATDAFCFPTPEEWSLAMTGAAQ